MSRILSVSINGAVVIEHDRDQPLTGVQRRSLDQLDQLMNAGIELEGKHLNDPDPVQRSRYVANRLISALERDREAPSAALCAWLALRMPGLREIVATDHPEGMRIELRLHSQAAVG